MLYYIELDRDRDFLDVHETKNIHTMCVELSINWNDVNAYLNGTDEEVKRLSCGVPMPFIKRKKGKIINMWLISYHREIIDMRNTRYISREVYNDIEFINSYSITDRGGLKCQRSSN